MLTSVSVPSGVTASGLETATPVPHNSLFHCLFLSKQLPFAGGRKDSMRKMHTVSFPSLESSLQHGHGKPRDLLLPVLFPQTERRR